MMRVTYIGPIAVVILPLTGHKAERHGDPIEVDDELGIMLCEQTLNWQPADPESQQVLDDFYRWVAAHEKRETIVDDEIVVRWMPRPAEATPAEPEPEPVSSPPAARSSRARSTSTQES